MIHLQYMAEVYYLNINTYDVRSMPRSIVSELGVWCVKAADCHKQTN